MTDSGYLDGDDNELIKALCHILNYLEIYRENILHTCFHQYGKKPVYAFMLAIFPPNIPSHEYLCIKQI